MSSQIARQVAEPRVFVRTHHEDDVVQTFQQWRALATRFASPQPTDRALVRSLRGLATAESRDRVFMLAGQAFIAVVPLLIIGATVSSSTGDESLGGYLIDRFSLTGVSADSVRVLFDRPPDIVSGISALSVVIVVISINGFARSLRQTFENAWDLPRSGAKGAVNGLFALVIMVVMFVTLTVIAIALERVTSRGVGISVQFPMAVVGWLTVTYFLLSRRVPLHALLRGAVYAALAQVVANVATDVFLPVVITRNAERYGAIGVAFALVSWLIIYAALIVSVAVVSAQLARTSSPSPAAQPRPPQDDTRFLRG